MSLLGSDAVRQIDFLRRQYLQRVDPEQLTLPAISTLRLPEVQAEIHRTIFDDNLHSFPPPQRYKFRVLKRIVHVLEESIIDPEEHEISNQLITSFAQLLAQPFISASTAAQQKCYVTYTLPSSTLGPPEITLLEARSLLASSGTTGLRTWEAALRLGAFLCSPLGKNFVQNKNVLELGAGIGFLAILCAKHLGAKRVLATDGSAEVINDLQSNLFLNGLEKLELIDTAVLKWGHMLNGGILNGPNEKSSLDLVLGADVTYDKKDIPALISTMRDFFDQYPNVKILISATVRNESTLSAFLIACDRNGFMHEDLATQLPQTDEQIGFFFPTHVPIRVFLITQARATKNDLTSLSS